LKKNIFHDWLGECRDRFGDEALFGVAVLFVMLFSSLTEAMGFHFVIGAFFGGLLLSRDFVGGPLHGNIQTTLNSITAGFLAPIFFAYIGLHFSGAAFGEIALLLAVLLLGMISKTLGGWIGGRIAGISHKECYAVGLILNGRGVMDLVVAEIALHRGIIDKGLFSALVLLSILSTFLGPILFKRLRLDLRGAGKEMRAEVV
jgi:Kef-type K+ transport system membrane component KefB